MYNKKLMIIDKELLKHIKENYKDLFDKLLLNASLCDRFDDNINSFNIYLGRSKKIANASNLAYLFSQDTNLNSNSITVFDKIQDIEKIINFAIGDFQNIDKNILLYLGKFPNFGFDVDGGSILAKQLIDTLKVRCNLDLAFIRKNKEIYHDSQVNKMIYIDYIDAFDHKFSRRLKNLETNKKILSEHEKYDYIISAHTSKFFGIDQNLKNFWRKTILFPMFCSSSYIRAGETVPAQYTELEKIVIRNVFKIITPSNTEKNDLIRDYNCDESKISVIYRGISNLFCFNPNRMIHKPVNIIYIASIKKQKNNFAALLLLEKLLRRENRLKLHLVGTIQDKVMYEQMLEYIKKNHLEDNVRFHKELTQSGVASLLEDMHIGISVSKWETFGRGIFECTSSGLPTFVLNDLNVIKEIANNNKGIVFSKNIEEMSYQIDDVINNHAKYIEMRDSLYELRKKTSYKQEQLSFVKTIFEN
jgi:glycosyltransferase involved in cell wall biosynthesis